MSLKFVTLQYNSFDFIFSSFNDKIQTSKNVAEQSMSDEHQQQPQSLIDKWPIAVSHLLRFIINLSNLMRNPIYPKKWNMVFAESSIKGITKPGVLFVLLIKSHISL